MKGLLSSLTMGLAVFAFVACSQEANQSAQTSSKQYEITESELNTVAEGSFAKFAIEGMTCQMGCVTTVNKKLKKIDGVISVEIEFDADQKQDYATVIYDASKTDPVKMAEEIESLAKGAYQVVGIEVAKQKTAEASNHPKATEEKKHLFSLSIPNPFEGVLASFGLGLPK
jgi:mercuric ion binding protein